MDDYTRGVQDGLKAASEKWAARCARAEAARTVMPLHPEIEGFYKAEYEQRSGMIAPAIERSVHYGLDPQWRDAQASASWEREAVKYAVLTAHCARAIHA